MDITYNLRQLDPVRMLSGGRVGRVLFCTKKNKNCFGQEVFKTVIRTTVSIDARNLRENREDGEEYRGKVYFEIKREILKEIEGNSLLVSKLQKIKFAVGQDFVDDEKRGFAYEGFLVGGEWVEKAYDLDGLIHKKETQQFFWSCLSFVFLTVLAPDEKYCYNDFFRQFRGRALGWGRQRQCGVLFIKGMGIQRFSNVYKSISLIARRISAPKTGFTGGHGTGEFMDGLFVWIRKNLRESEKSRLN